MTAQTILPISLSTAPPCAKLIIVEFSFDGEVWHWRGPSPFHFVTVPDDVSAVLLGVSTAVTYGWGMIPATLTIGETQWQTSLFPKDGGHVVPVKDAVRKAEGIEVGDVVSITVSVTI